MIRRHAALLVQLHVQLHEIDAPMTLPAPFGDGGALLHLDLQPENVMLTAKGAIVLDWEWAARGPGEADFAHTVLQLDTSEVPGGRFRRMAALFGRQLFTPRFVDLAGGRDALRPHLRAVATYRLAQRALTDRERSRIRIRTRQGRREHRIARSRLSCGLAVVEDMAMTTHFVFLATWLRARFDTDRGASLVEYALLVALIAVVCIAAITLLGNNASSKFSDVGTSLSN